MYRWDNILLNPQEQPLEIFIHQKLNGTLPMDPQKKVARAIRYSSLGVRSSSVGPVGDFLDFRLKHDLFLLVTILAVVFTMGFLDAHWFSSSMALGAHVLPASPNWWRYPWCENPLPFFRFIIFSTKTPPKDLETTRLTGSCPTWIPQGRGDSASCMYAMSRCKVRLRHVTRLNRLNVPYF